MNEERKTAGIAIWSLVLGILGLTCLGPLGAIPAVICGHIGISRIKKASGILAGQGMSIAGLVLGYVGFVLSVLILPAILLPALSNARQATMEAQARMEIHSLHTAVRAYFNQYGKLPDGTSNDEIVKALTGTNPHQIVFLEAPASSMKDGSFVDPWSGIYVIEVDSDYNNSIMVGAQPVQDVCAVWSYGANKKNEKGMGDDITSW